MNRQNAGEPAFSREALRRPSGTRFLCKKPVPDPSGKNSILLAVDHRILRVPSSECEFMQRHAEWTRTPSGKDF